MIADLTRRERFAWKALELILRDRNILIGAILEGVSPYESAWAMADALIAAEPQVHPRPGKCTHGTQNAAPANREERPA